MFKLYKAIKINNSIYNNLIKNGIKNRRSLSVSVARRQQAAEAPAESTILVEKDSNITLIGINREKHRNSIDGPTALKLSEAIYAFEADKQSPVAVLYGIGGSFSAGNDIGELEKQVGEGSLDFLLRQEGSVGPTRRHLRKPIVCGISGFCVASGLELALMCDLRVMEDTAVLGFFNRRLGVPISDGGTVRLAAMVGFSRATDLILSGRRVSGKEALKMGLINRLVATGTALGQAVNLAFCITKFPMNSLLHDRDALHANMNIYERPGFAYCVHNEIMNTNKEIIQEIKEGVKRFKQSEVKGAKTSSFEIKEKSIPDWEKAEIAIEEKYAKKKQSQK